MSAAAAAAAEAQAPERAGATPVSSSFPSVTFGILTFLQYQAQLHESNGYNAFDVTRGYLNIQARLSDRIRVRFTPDVRPTTDASLNQNLALRLEYASLDVQATDNIAIMFGLHEMPWLAFEETVNRYRVVGPFFSERLGLIPGTTDLGVSLKRSTERTDFHVGVYNGEGQGRAEIDKYKSIDGRATFRPFSQDSELAKVTDLGVLSVRLVHARSTAQRRDRDGQLRKRQPRPHGAVPLRDRQSVRRRGHRAPRLLVLRRGPSGSDGLVRHRRSRSLRSGRFERQRLAATPPRRRCALERDLTRATGCRVSLEQSHQTSNSQLLERRLLAQTHIEF